MSPALQTALRLAAQYGLPFLAGRIAGGSPFAAAIVRALPDLILSVADSLLLEKVDPKDAEAHVVARLDHGLRERGLAEGA